MTVKFKEATAAQACILKMNGRFFDGRKVRHLQSIPYVVPDFVLITRSLRAYIPERRGTSSPTRVLTSRTRRRMSERD
jgi:hypothetical protein